MGRILGNEHEANIRPSPRERHPLPARVRARGQEAAVENERGRRMAVVTNATNGGCDTDTGNQSGADRSCALPRIFLHG
jgi:hypothetical protein